VGLPRPAYWKWERSPTQPGNTGKATQVCNCSLNNWHHRIARETPALRPGRDGAEALPDVLVEFGGGGIGPVVSVADESGGGGELGGNGFRRWGVPGAGAHHLSESDQFEVGGSGGAAPHGERLEPLYWIIFPEGFPGVVFFLLEGAAMSMYSPPPHLPAPSLDQAEIHPVVFERFKIQNAIAFRPDAILLTGVVTVDDGHSYGEAHDQGRFLPLHPEQGNVLKKLDHPDFYQALGRYLNDWNRPS
jgi:hypothetical protein